MGLLRYMVNKTGKPMREVDEIIKFIPDDVLMRDYVIQGDAGLFFLDAVLSEQRGGHRKL